MLKRRTYSEAVDMWAFGVIAYVLLCGCLPFDDDAARISSPPVWKSFSAFLGDGVTVLAPSSGENIATISSRRRVDGVNAP